MADEQIDPSSAELVFQRTDGFVEKYANNIRFESSVWDIRILFGLLNQSLTPATVDQHTAMNVPWAQAKLMAYFLQVNVIFHEIANGTINIPDAIMPESVSDELLETFKDDPAAIERLQRLRKLHEQLR
jgi:hypothetical protein